MIMNILAKSIATSSAKPGAMREPGEKTLVRFRRRFGIVTFFNRILDLSFPIFFVVFLGMGLIRFFWAVWQVMTASHSP